MAGFVDDTATRDAVLDLVARVLVRTGHLAASLRAALRIQDLGLRGIPLARLLQDGVWRERALGDIAATMARANGVDQAIALVAQEASEPDARDRVFQRALEVLMTDTRAHRVEAEEALALRGASRRAAALVRVIQRYLDRGRMDDAYAALRHLVDELLDAAADALAAAEAIPERGEQLRIGESVVAPLLRNGKGQDVLTMVERAWGPVRALGLLAFLKALADSHAPWRLASAQDWTEQALRASRTLPNPGDRDLAAMLAARAFAAAHRPLRALEAARGIRDPHPVEETRDATLRAVALQLARDGRFAEARSLLGRIRHASWRSAALAELAALLARAGRTEESGTWPSRPRRSRRSLGPCSNGYHGERERPPGPRDRDLVRRDRRRGGAGA